MLMFKGKDGKRIEVRFRGGIQIDSTSRFTTENKEIQDYLENCNGFGTDYYIESVKEVDAEKPEPVKEKKAEKPKVEKEIMDEVKGSERFRNLVEMKNRMAELGISLEDNANYAQAKAAAVKAGYDFQIQK